MPSDCRDKCHAKEFSIVSVFIPFAAPLGGVMYCADGESLAIKILSLASTVVCLILLAIRHPLHNNDSAGNNNSTIPATFALLQGISTHENIITTGLHQQ